MSESVHQGVATKRCKPKVSTTIDRKRLVRPKKEQMILNKKNETVIGRTTQSSFPVSSKATPRQTIASGRASVNNTISRANQKSSSTTSYPTAKEIKEAAISKALLAASNRPAMPEKKAHVNFKLRRLLLALVCASAAVFAIVYFVNLNAPNISLKVAAMQTGIEASYPSYVPRDFDLSDITSESGKVTLNFKNSSTGDAFTLIEEKSSWDSNALLNNFVKNEYADNYVVVKEQGLTIYISDRGGATWVNGGIMFRLDVTSGSLTKKQIKTIAVSL